MVRVDSLLGQLLAAAGRSENPASVAMVSHLADAKLVRKPWGSERWLVPENASFAFKLVHVLSGQRTSLHYHRYKEEAYLVIEGEAVLHLADSPGVDLVSRRLVPGAIARIGAGMVHRLSAITDTSIVEVSTTELDDVVRLHDDWDRRDGRIAGEHG